MTYTLVLNFPSREQGQLWVEETFDLSIVQLQNVLPSAFKGQVIARVEVTHLEKYMEAAFDDGLNKLMQVWPVEKRMLSWWSKETS